MAAFWNPVSPFDVMLIIFNEEYGDYSAEVEFTSEDTKGEWFGRTIFREEGSPVIQISIGCTIEGAMEVLAHELAHVVCGVRENDDDHDSDWEKTFEYIFEKWAERMIEIYANFHMDGGSIQ